VDGDGIEHILVRYPQHDRGFLIPILQEVQEHYGFLAPERVDEVAAFTGASASEVFGSPPSMHSSVSRGPAVTW